MAAAEHETLRGKNTQDVAAERAFQAAQAASAGAVRPTPKSQVDRYRLCRQWRLYPKEYMFRLLRASGARRVCDLGCGDGETSSLLALLGYEVTGLDISSELVRLARRRAELDEVADRTEFVVGDVAAPDLAGAPFDLLFVNAVLHHLDIRVAVRTMRALLKPEGIALIKEPVAFSPALQWLRDRVPVPKEVSPNERQLNRDDFQVIDAGFRASRRRYFRLFCRLARVMPEHGSAAGKAVLTALGALDYFLLNRAPGCSRLAGTVVMQCTRRV
ncbi:MAG: class I SAM-dependent methyltransferase [Kiritimatiellae bacterium]|nr:class I SAM-dependent methyltransferase [Kiritimatiellia bacterium]